MSAAQTLTPNDIPAMLAQFRRERFYGSVELKLELGEVVLIRKTETIKPTPDSSKQSRDSDGPRNR